MSRGAACWPPLDSFSRCEERFFLKPVKECDENRGAASQVQTDE